MQTSLLDLIEEGEKLKEQGMERALAGAEIWKDVVGYEGRYLVSNIGNIKSVERGRDSNKNYLIKEKIRKRQIDKSNGYLSVMLFKDGKGKRLSVHRLVATAFIPNPENLPEVNHLDYNKLNPHVSNLEWCTASENKKHMAKRDGYKNSMQGMLGGLNPNAKKVIQKDVTGNVIKIWASMADAARSLKVGVASISNCANNSLKTCRGFKWEKAS